MHWLHNTNWTRPEIRYSLYFKTSPAVFESGLGIFLSLISTLGA